MTKEEVKSLVQQFKDSASQPFDQIASAIDSIEVVGGDSSAELAAVKAELEFVKGELVAKTQELADAKVVLAKVDSLGKEIDASIADQTV